MRKREKTLCRKRLEVVQVIADPWPNPLCTLPSGVLCSSPFLSAAEGNASAPATLAFWQCYAPPVFLHWCTTLGRLPKLGTSQRAVFHSEVVSRSACALSVVPAWTWCCSLPHPLSPVSLGSRPQTWPWPWRHWRCRQLPALALAGVT